MKIQAKLLNMASNELLSTIPYSEYSRIKLTDNHPQFRAYVVGHEGESKGEIVKDGQSLGNMVKKWLKSAIYNLFEKIKFGTQLFLGHAYDNKYDSRVPIGEIVGKKVETIKDKLSTIAIAYIKPEFRHLPLDVASIEADLALEIDKQNGELLADVKGISGVALGNSNIETPGFPGATLLAQVQEFAEQKFQSFENQNGGGKVTLDEIKKAIQEEKLSPSDVFALGAILEDSGVKDYISAETRKAKQGEYEHRRRTDKKFDKSSEEWEKEKEDYSKKIKEYEVEIAKGKATGLFEKLKTDRKLDEKTAKFVEKKLPNFQPKELEKIEKEFETFADDQIKEYADIASEVFGQKTEKKEEPKKGSSTTISPSENKGEPAEDDALRPGII